MYPPHNQTYPQMQAQCDKRSMSLTSDTSRLCAQLGETLDRVTKIADALLGSEPSDMACSSGSAPIAGLRYDLDRAFALSDRIFGELTRIETRL